MEKNKKRTWRIDLTDEQFRCVISGMEFYHRMMCGQIEELRNITPYTRAADELRDTIKAALFPELSSGESYGWNGGSPDPFFDKQQAVSYQIYREMKHQWMVREGHYNVYTFDTLRSGKADPLIVKQI